MKQCWEVKKLGDLCNLMTGGTPSRSKPEYFIDGDIKWLVSGDIHKTDIYDCAGRITNEAMANSNAKYLPINSVIIALNGQGKTRGTVAILRVKATCNQSLVSIYPKHINEILPEYIYCNLHGRYDEIRRITGDDGNDRRGLNMPLIRNIEIPLPPLKEQQRIVAILDEAFAAIAKAKANAEQNLKNAKELFDIQLHKYYSNKEAGLEEKSLREIAEYFNGLTYSPKNVCEEEGIIVLRSSNVQNNQLDFNDVVRVNLTVKDKIIVKEGDILMCSRNGSKRLVGKTATIKNLDEEMTFGTFMMIIRSQFNPYLSWFFKSNDFRKQISGGENTMINQITRYMLDEVVLSFPPIEIQNEIVQKLDALSAETKQLEAIYQQKIKDLDELKKSILQKAFAGELNTTALEV